MWKTQLAHWHATITDYNKETGETYILIQDDQNRLFRYTLINATPDDIADIISVKHGIARSNIDYKGEIRNRKRMVLMRYIVLDIPLHIEPPF